MNKKKFPKAVAWTADDMRRAAADTEQRSSPARAAGVTDRSAAGSVASGAAANVIELMPKSEGAPAAAALSLSPDAKSNMTLRRLQAIRIVERHANYSAIGGIIPLSILNVAGVTAIIVRMVRALSRHYGVAFEANRARAVAIGLMGGAMPTGLATVTASALIYLVPGGNLFGLAVSSVSASAGTRSIGRTLIEHFENGATLADFPALGRR